MNKKTMDAAYAVLGSILLTACASTTEISSPQQIGFTDQDVKKDVVGKHPTLPSLPLINRIAWPETTDVTPDRASERLYSFVAKNLPIEQALQIFAKAYGLNIIADKDVSGSLTVEFHDLPFDHAMEAMLEVLDLHWQRQGNLISVKSWETRNFTINYIRLVRSGSGSTQAQVSSGISSGESSSGDTGAISIKQHDTVEFWKELEEQLAILVSEDGRLIVNRMAGTVQISDHYPRVKEVARYVSHINQAIHRQVEIDVKILEISLNDDFSLGIDWSRIASAGSNGIDANINTTNIIAQPAGGFAAKLPAIAFNIFNTRNSGRNFSAVLNALKEQGEVRTVSQPKIRTLNNQAAMIKVGTDRTFFRRELVIDNTSAGSTTSATDIPQVVTEGITLAITPQISIDGWIMMDVSPIVTRVSSVSNIMDESGNVQSSAPNLDIRQTSSLVRTRSGETIVIGGLIQDQISNTKRSVPILSDIPIIGNLFQGTYEVKAKKELVIFLTAHLVHSSSTKQ